MQRSKFWLMVGCLAVLAGCRSGHQDTADIGMDDRRSADWEMTWEDAGVGLRAAALPTRSANSTPQAFSALSVAETGLDYALGWTPGPDYKFEIYNSLPGGGICIGDYDGDDLPDVFLTQPNVGCRLYRNLGRMRFVDVTRQVGIVDNQSGQGAVMIDIDGDGDLDLYVCNDERPNQLYINDGAGQFQDRAAQFGLDFCGASVQMAFADYDRDGDLDAYLVTNRVDPPDTVPSPQLQADGTPLIPKEDREFVDVLVPADGRPRVIKSAQYDHLYRNNGDRTFTDVSDQAGLQGAYWGLSAIWWDFDRDGWMDLYVSNDFYSPDQLYRNNGDGTFTDVAPTSLPHTPWYSMGTDIADINNDGRFDLMGSDMSGTNHYKQKASMGDMSTTAWFLTHPTPRQYMRNALYLNTGTDRFLEIAQLAGVANTDWTWSLKFADLDEDGWTDLFVTNGMNRDWTNSDLRNLSNRMKSEDEKMQVWIASPPRNDANLAFRNLRDLRFASVGHDWGLAAEKVSYGAALSDLDRDGDLDLIVNNAEQTPDVYQNNSHEAHRVLIRLDDGNANRFGIGATVRVTSRSGSQWRQLNSSQGYMSANEPLIHFGLGADDRIDQLDVVWADGSHQQYSDLPADRYYYVSKRADLHKLDAAPKQTPCFTAYTPLPDARHYETPFNDFARQPLLPNQLSQLGPGMAWSDIDDDGDADLFLGGASGQAGQLWVNDGEGNFRPAFDQPWEADVAYEDMSALFFDADGDDDVDLYVVSGGVECEPGDELLQDRLYLNDGSGRFQRASHESLPAIRDSGSIATAADVDRDGDLDLFVGGRVVPGQYPTSPRSYLLVNHDGQFVDATADLAPELQDAGMVTSAVWSDADKDGWIDLLVTIEWGPVRHFRNASGRLVDRTSASELGQRTGWFNSILAFDADNDGDMDYAVGNQGWNTKYHASPSRPTLLYYGDFEQSGRKRLVEAEFEDNHLFPVRGRSCSTNAMPFLGQKFTKFHDFAVASLEEIYSSSRLAAAERFSANSLESGVWLNEGNGHFRFVAFPVIGQVAPVFGMETCDINWDGNADLLLAQNFFGPQPETGRADGGIGLLMLGAGDGTFTPVVAEESGIVVPGDATSLCQADIDGDMQPEYVMATNDGPIHVFRAATDYPSSGSGRRSHCVRLHSGQPNRRAVGGLIMAHYSDGTAKAFEISAGGGYLSQSPPELCLTSDQHRTLQLITIRWPTGQTSSHPIDPNDTWIDISSTD